MPKEKKPERLTYEANCNEKRAHLFLGLFALSTAAFIGSYVVGNLGLYIISTLATGASPVAAFISGKVADSKDDKSAMFSQGRVDTNLVSDAHIITRRNLYREPSLS